MKNYSNYKLKYIKKLLIYTTSIVFFTTSSILYIFLNDSIKVSEINKTKFDISDNLNGKLELNERKQILVDYEKREGRPVLDNSASSQGPSSQEDLPNQRENIDNENQNENKNNEPNYLAGEVIVKYVGDINVLKNELGINDLEIESLGNDIYVLRSNSIKTQSDKYFLESNFTSQDKTSIDPYLTEVINKLDSKGSIYAEPNYIYSTQEFILVPYDKYFNNQWALNNTGQSGGRDDADIDALEAWQYRPDVNIIKVAVIDTGVDYLHPDIDDSILKDGSGNIIGYDFVNNDNDPMDDRGHGTHVAGIIAAERSNIIGIAGICSFCQIMPIKFLNSEGKGVTTNALKSIRFAIDKGAEIINASWGSYGYSNAMQEIINEAYDKGIIFIAAAGNDGVSYRAYPASYDHVISVAATNEYDTYADFSNWGTTIDVSAPGVNIASLFPKGADLDGERDHGCEDANLGDTNDPIDGYGYCSGTSMAAPHVSAVAGLIKSFKQDIEINELFRLIYSSVDDLGDPDEYEPGWDYDYGYGRINALYAINAVDRPSYINAQITYPNPYKLFGKYIEIKGTADASDFSYYQIDISQVIEGKSNFIVIYKSLTPVLDGLLGSWNCESYTNGRWQIRLRVYNKNNEFKEAEVIVDIDNDLHIGWPKYRAYEDTPYYNTIVVGDIENDGKEEIFYGSEEGVLYGFREDGSYLNGVWPVYLSRWNAGTPALADMDNDGIKEIVVGITGGSIDGSEKLLYVIRSDGTNYSGWPKFEGELDDGEVRYITDEPTISDINDDGNLEILIGMNDLKMHAILIDGSEAPGWPITIDTTNYTYVPEDTWKIKDLSGASVGDIDGDGDKEIIFGNWHYLHAYHHNGKQVEGNWPFDTNRKDISPEWAGIGVVGISPVLGDIDGDGLNEIIAPSGPRTGVTFPFSQWQVYAWNGDGTLAEGWPAYQYYDRDRNLVDVSGSCQGSSAALGDLDRDGLPEVVVSDRRGMIYVWDGDGKPFIDKTSSKPTPHWPLSYPYDIFYGRTKSAAIADVDDDNIPEILIGTLGSFKVFERDGSQLWSKEDTNVEVTPVVSDIDNDKKFEVLTISDYTIYIWDLKGSYDIGKVEWGQFGNNFYHTDVYIPNILEIVIQDLVNRLNLDNSISISWNDDDIRYVNWGDSCLGLPKSGEYCTPGIVEGYIIMLTYTRDDGLNFLHVYYTDLYDKFRYIGSLPPR